MSEASGIITGIEPKAEPKMKTILSFEVNENGGTQVHINTTNEAFLALALRRMGQVVDLYIAEQEAKRIEDANRIIKATVPPSVADRLRM